MKKIECLIWTSFVIVVYNSCFSEKDNYYRNLQAKLEKVNKGMHYNEVLRIINDEPSYNYKIYNSSVDSNFEMDFGYPSGLSSSSVYVAFSKDSFVRFLNPDGR